jgi:rhodanese-related sulfurtransferase
MEQVYEFIGNHPILSGAFIILLIAWIGWEIARLGRKWRELDSLAAVRLINQDDAVIIDVSNSTDFAKGHIVGAINVTQSQIESGNRELLKLRERPVLVYCKNGQTSPAVANKLVALGFTQVHVLAGGLAQWLADQQPVSRAKGSGKAGSKHKKDGKREGQKTKKKGKKQGQQEATPAPATSEDAGGGDAPARDDPPKTKNESTA